MGTEIKVFCPKCRRFVLKGQFNRVETICNDRDCRTNFVVEVGTDGSMTTRTIPPQKIKA